MTIAKIKSSRDLKRKVADGVHITWKFVIQVGDKKIINEVLHIHKREIADAINNGMATEAVEKKLQEFCLNADKIRSDYHNSKHKAS